MVSNLDSARSMIAPRPLERMAVSPGAGVHGRAEVVFSVKSGNTKLSHLYQHAPLRVLFPSSPTEDVLGAVVVNTSGGLVGGDSLDISVALGPGAQALVTTQAAEKLYRSIGPDCLVTVRIEVRENAWLEWLPQETIIFDGARLRRRTTLTVSPGARLLAGEVLVFGRIARGEGLSYGLIHDEWQLCMGGRLLWADSLHLAGDLAAKLAAPAGFRGSKAMATFIYVAQDAPRWLEAARELLVLSRAETINSVEDSAYPVGDELWAGASCINPVLSRAETNVLLARWLSTDAAVVRRSYGIFWKGFRSMVGNLPPRLPTIWNI
jgi:urease accessory protein